MSDVLKTIAGELIRKGAPTLGGMIGTAIGGPAGAVVGGVAGKGLEVLADVLGVPATPEAVGGAVANAGPDDLAAAEEAAKTMAPIWAIEAQRVAAQEAAEMSRGFASWQLWKGVIQAVVWVGWAAILVCALFGGNLGVKTLLPMGELVGTWGSVTMAWLVVYNGGHTIKEVVANGTFNWRGK